MDTVVRAILIAVSAVAFLCDHELNSSVSPDFGFVPMNEHLTGGYSKAPGEL